MKRILIATDGSPGARAAVLDGLELASATGASVTFVYVRHAIPLLGSPYYQRKLSKQLKQARAALDEAMAEAGRLGVDADEDVAEGDAVEQILCAAIYREAELIVVGSRGLGAVGEAFLGSVSKALVELSPIPVVVIKSEDVTTPPKRRILVGT